MKIRKKKAIIVAFAIVCTGTLVAQSNKQDCAKPSVLRITKLGSDLYYQLDLHKQHKLFTLGEVSDAVRNCTPERMIFVVADPNVTPAEMWLPAKEQITNVRYFVQFRSGEVTELSFGLSFPKLPLTPDVKGIPPYDDTPPPPTKTPRGSN